LGSTNPMVHGSPTSRHERPAGQGFGSGGRHRHTQLISSTVHVPLSLNHRSLVNNFRKLTQLLSCSGQTESAHVRSQSTRSSSFCLHWRALSPVAVKGPIKPTSPQGAGMGGTVLGSFGSVGTAGAGPVAPKTIPRQTRAAIWSPRILRALPTGAMVIARREITLQNTPVGKEVSSCGVRTAFGGHFLAKPQARNVRGALFDVSFRTVPTPGEVGLTEGFDRGPCSMDLSSRNDALSQLSARQRRKRSLLRGMRYGVGTVQVRRLWGRSQRLGQVLFELRRSSAGFTDRLPQPTNQQPHNH